MHTVMMVGLGVLLLAAFVLGGLVLRRGAAAGARWFILPWLAVSLVNLSVGVSHGYSVAGELPFLAVVFGIPAGAAWLASRQFGASRSIR